MSDPKRLWNFRERLPTSVPGCFYIDDQCLDCDLCRATAPMLFARNDHEGRSYVFKQPENEAEMALAREALEGCCTEAIQDDGEEFDWGAYPALKPYGQLTEEERKARLEEESRALEEASLWQRLWALFARLRKG